MTDQDKKRLEEIRGFCQYAEDERERPEIKVHRFLLRLLDEEREKKERLHYALDLIVLNEKVTPEISEIAFNATHRDALLGEEEEG